MSARIWPLIGSRAEAGFHWIVLDIVSYAPGMIMIADPTIKVVLAPEGAIPIEESVCFPRCDALETAHDACDGRIGTQHDMHMVGHYHPTAKFEGVGFLSAPEGRDHQSSDFGPAQPDGAGCMRVEQSVECYKLRATGGVHVSVQCAGEGAGKAPCQETGFAGRCPVG